MHGQNWLYTKKQRRRSCAAPIQYFDFRRNVRLLSKYHCGVVDDAGGVELVGPTGEVTAPPAGVASGVIGADCDDTPVDMPPPDDVPDAAPESDIAPLRCVIDVPADACWSDFWLSSRVAAEPLEACDERIM